MHVKIKLSLSILTFVFYGLYTSLTVQSQILAPGPKLVVILFSGFRWDFLNYTNSGFKLMQDEGVRAHSMTPVFPSLSYPNAYSLMTGLYSEHHSITGDYMYDRPSEEYFLGFPPDYSTENPKFWEHAEPFWARASREGLRVEMHWWPGCHIPVFQVRPEVCIPYRNSGAKLSQLPAKLSGVLNSLQNGLANVAFIYVDDLLQIARNFGPTSPESVAVIQTMDYTLHLFQNELKARNLQNEINILVTSDHGVSRVNVAGTQRLIDLQTVFPDQREIEKIIDLGPVVGIFPTIGREELFFDFYQKRYPTGMKLYRKFEIPDHWGFRRGEYTPPILAVAEPGYVLVWGGERTKLVTAKSPYWLGVNGYDPYDFADMRGIFLARGPDFRQNYKAAVIQITDVYNLMCAVTGISPHRNQGAWNSVRIMLSQLPVTEALFSNSMSVFRTLTSPVIIVSAIVIHTMVRFCWRT